MKSDLGIKFGSSYLRLDSIVAIMIFGLIFVGIAWVIYDYFPVGSDWEGIFRPATIELISARSPYIDGYYNPPWTLIPLIPLLFLSPKTASVILSMVNILVFGFVAYRLDAKPLALGAIVFSPAVLYGVFDPNVDWLVALGLLLPPQIGLFFLMVKPQLTSVLVLFFLVEAWRIGGYKQSLKTFLPIIITLVISFLLYGLWPLRSMELSNVKHNISIWPMAIPIGLVLAAIAIRRQKKNLAIIASPFLSPYVAAYSLAVPILALLPSKLYVILAVIGLWIIQYIWRGPL